MKKVRRSNLPFNSTPLGEWGEREAHELFVRAEIKPTERTGKALPRARTVADLDNVANRLRRRHDQAR